MKEIVSTKLLCVILVLAIILGSGCASTTVFQTRPDNADVYIKGQNLGTTPYTYTDRKISGASTSVTFKKEGYKDYLATLKRKGQLNVGALFGGLFFIYPYLWILSYDDEYSFDLIKAINDDLPEEAQIMQNIQVENNINYLTKEDDRIKFTVDSVVTTNSLPGNLITVLDESISPTLAGISARNNIEYVLVYYQIKEKIKLNVGINQPLPRISLVDESGKLYRIILERGQSFIRFAGKGMKMWNPAGPQKEGIIINTQYMFFQMPKGTTPVRLNYTYNYKLEQKARKVNTGQIGIDLVQR